MVSTILLLDGEQAGAPPDKKHLLSESKKIICITFHF